MNARLSIVWILTSMVLNGCVTNPAVSYQFDVSPILKDNCLQCHIPPDGSGYLRTGLNMASYKTLMNGTIYGPVIVAGDSRRSILNKLVEGRAGNYMRMPHNKKDSLTEEEIKTLRLWVDQDAKNN